MDVVSRPIDDPSGLVDLLLDEASANAWSEVSGDSLRRAVEATGRHRLAVERAATAATFEVGEPGRWRALIGPDPFTSDLLGVNAGVVTGWFAPRGEAVDGASEAIAAAQDDLGIDYLTTRVDAANVPLLRSATSDVFTLLGLSQSYICRPADRAIAEDTSRDTMLGDRSVRGRVPGFETMVVTPEEFLALDLDTSEMRARSTTSFLFDRYHLDPLVPTSAADRAFQIWVGHVLDGEWFSHATIGVLDGRLATFSSFQLDNELSAVTGQRIGGRSLTLAAADYGGYTTRAFDLFLRRATSPIDFLVLDVFAQNMKIVRYFNLLPELVIEHSTAVLRRARPGVRIDPPR